MLEFKFGAANFNSALKRYQQKLDGVRVRGSDLTQVAPQIQEALSVDVLKRFDTAPKTQTGGRVYGNKIWNPLKDSTLAQRPDRIGKRILTDTGRLKRSFRLKSPENIATNNRKSITFGSKVPYANRQSAMRQIVFWHPELLRKVTSILSEYVFNEGLRETGGRSTKADGRR